MMTEKSGHKKHRGLMAIAALKFVNGFGVVALGFGALHFLNGDLPKEFAHWMELLRADPHNRYLLWVVEKLSDHADHQLCLCVGGMDLYSVLFLSVGAWPALARRR